MEIRGIAGKPGIGQVQPTASARPAAVGGEELSADGDQVQISPVSRYLDQYSKLPPIRADKVEQARAAVQAGAMDTDERLSIAIDRLLDDLLGS